MADGSAPIALSDLEREGFVARAQARLEIYPAPAKVLLALVTAAPKPVSLERLDEIIENRMYRRAGGRPRKRVHTQISLLRTALRQAAGFQRGCIAFTDDGGYAMTRQAAARAQRFVLGGD